MITDKTKIQKIQSLKKENEYDNKKEDIMEDPENLSKNFRNEINSSFYEEFNKDVKNKEINKQLANSKKSTNITERKKNVKKNNNAPNIIKTTLDYDANQKKFIEKEKTIINLEANKKCLQKKTKLDEHINNKNNLNKSKNINVNKNLKKNVNKNNTNKNNESKNNVNNYKYHNSPNIEINEDLIDELNKSYHEEEGIDGNNFYNEINEMIDEEFKLENNEDEFNPEKAELALGTINCNQNQYENNKIKEQDRQSIQDMPAIRIFHNTVDSSTNSITHNYNNFLNT